MPVVIQESKSGSHELSHIISAAFYWTKQEKYKKLSPPLELKHCRECIPIFKSTTYLYNETGPFKSELKYIDKVFKYFVCRSSSTDTSGI